MKKNNSLFQSLDSNLITIANCWHIKLRNGQSIGFTDHDSDITYDNFKYLSFSALSQSSIESKNTLAVDNLEIRGILDNNIIRKQDLLNGIYDMAEVLVFQVDYYDLSKEKIILHRGWIGEITIKDNKFFAEIRGIAQKTSTNIGEVYSETCRAEFGDKKCRVDLQPFSYEASITTVKNNSTFYSKELEKHRSSFSYGRVKFISGKNQGLEVQIKESYDGNIKISQPFPLPLEEKDHFVAIYGCNKRFETCSKVYDNFLNFRGEPHIPEL